MATAPPHLANLSEQNRRMLDNWLRQFEQTWSESRLSAAVRDLPPVGHVLRLPALIEMVCIDLKRQWKLGRKPRVEAYLQFWPEIGTTQSVPLALLQAEYLARKGAGDPVSASQYEMRFPALAQPLQRWEEEQFRVPAPTPPEGSHPGAPTSPGAPPAPAPAVTAVGPSSPMPPTGTTRTSNRPTEQIGRYRLLKQLGRGGMGTVYLAEDTQLGRQVALKVPNFTPEDSPELLQRFFREAKSAAGLSHSNICPVFDFGEVNGIHYLTMAYIEGKSLSDTLKEVRQMPQQQSAKIITKLARALQEAHDKGVIHRDLKPGNIIITPKGEPIIMDFGLARRLNSDDPRLTRAGAVLGTPAYMPPEMLNGTPEHITARCDIYSLGVILYEMLTGRAPFEGPPTVIWGQLLLEEPAPPSTYRGDLDPHLQTIVLKAMAKRAEARYRSMSEFAEALEAWAEGRTRAPGPPSQDVDLAGKPKSSHEVKPPSPSRPTPGSKPPKGPKPRSDERTRPPGHRSPGELPQPGIAAWILLFVLGLAVASAVAFLFRNQLAQLLP